MRTTNLCFVGILEWVVGHFSHDMTYQSLLHLTSQGLIKVDSTNQFMTL